MKPTSKGHAALLAEIELLQMRVGEAESTLEAIREGAIDGLVVQTSTGPKVFSLQGAETPYRVLVEAMNEGAATLRHDGSVLYANHRLAELVGRPLESLTGGSILDACVAEERSRLKRLLATVGADGVKAEFTLARPDGQTIPVQLSISPLNLPDAAGVCLVATDLTEQKRATDALREANEQLENRVAERTSELWEANAKLQVQAEELTTANEELRVQTEELAAANEELRQSERRLQTARAEAEAGRLRLEAVMEALPVGMAIIDDKGGNIDSNSAFEQIWGQPRPPTNSVHDYAAYKGWWVDTGKPVAPDEWASTQALRTGQSVVSQLVKIQRFDGAHAFILNSAAPIRAADGKVIGSTVAIQDVTALHKAEEELYETQQRLRALMDAAPVGISFSDDATCRRITGNPAVLAQFEVLAEHNLSASAPDADAPGRQVQFFLEGRRITDSELPLQRAVAENREIPPMELEVVLPSGRRWFAQASGAPVRDRQGRVIAGIAVTVDVTDRHLAEAAVRESRAKLQAAFASMTEAIFVADAQGRLIDFNDEFIRYHRFRNRDECSRTVADCPKYLDAWHADGTPAPPEQWAMARALHGETASGVEYRLRRKETGETWWGNYSFAPIKDQNGGITGAIVAASEITDRKQAEESLRRSEERFRLLSETASRLLTAEKPQEVVDELCREVTEHLDCQAFFNYLADEQAGRMHLNACAGIPKKEAKKIEWLEYGAAVCGCVARDGERVIVEDIPNAHDPRTDLVASYGIKAYACHALAAQGKVLGTLSFGAKTRTRFSADDLSLMKMVADQVAAAIDRIRSQEALQENEQRLEQQVNERTEALARTIDQLEGEVRQRAFIEKELQRRSQMLEGFFQHTITPLAFMDKEFNFIRVNEAYARADRKRPEEFIGRNHFDLYPDKENHAIFQDVVRTKEPYHAHSRPFNYPQEPRRTTYWNWLLTPLLDEAGAVQSLVLNLEDVTDRQRAFEELERRASQLQRLTLELSQAEDQERQRLARILHDDLQQLLVGAKFHVNTLIRRVKDNGEVKEMLTQVYGLISESIDKSRSLSHELMPPLLYQVALADALAWLGQQMRQTCGLEVETDVGAGIDLNSDTLKSFVYKATQELLFNVVKHAHVKRAKLQLRRLKGYVRLVVSDEGRGFDPSTLGKANGFGLFSIQERARLLGGWMKFKSTPGSGSVFIVAIPDNQKVEDERQKTGDAGRASPHDQGTSEGARPTVRSPSSVLRVMLVDDHKVMREGVATMLNEQPDIEVVAQAGNGRDAVSMAKQLQPDVIVMDVVMPIMGGEEATRRIKSHLPQTRIIGLSLSEEAAVSHKMRRAGAERYISKADPSETLLAAIRGRPVDDP